MAEQLVHIGSHSRGMPNGITIPLLQGCCVVFSLERWITFLSASIGANKNILFLVIYKVFHYQCEIKTVETRNIFKKY